MPTTGGLDPDGRYHPTWSPAGSAPKEDPPGKKAEARRLTRVRRFRYYPVRVVDGWIEVGDPRASPGWWVGRCARRGANSRTTRQASSGSSVTVSRARSASLTVPSAMSVSRAPVEQPRPVLGADEDDREVADLAGLDEGQRLEQLVERAEAAGQDHERVGVLHEHRLAREEVPELHGEVDVGIERLLVGQLDVAADRQAAGLLAAAVGGLHDPRPAAGDDRPAVAGQPAPDVAGLLVDRRPSPPGPIRTRSPPARPRPGRRSRRRTRTGSGAPARGLRQERRPGRPGEELLVLGHRRIGREMVGGLGLDRDPAAPVTHAGLGRRSIGHAH